MNPKVTRLFCVLVLMAAACALNAQTPAGTAFTYQGQVKKAGTALNATADFQFSLWNALAAGGQVGATVNASNVTVDHGLFTVPLDFGSGAFAGDARWLEIAVRSPHDPNNITAYTTLTPRQELKPTPYALYALAPWTTGGAGTLAYTGGKVGIGTTAPTERLHVTGTAWGTSAARIEKTNPNDWMPALVVNQFTTPDFGTGIVAQGGEKGIVGQVAPSGSALYMGVQGTVQGGSGENYGVVGNAQGSNENYGVAGNARDGSYLNFGVDGSAMGSGWNAGVNGSASDGYTNFGVRGWAHGTTTNYGVYGDAGDGTTNYGGYFVGDVHATGNVTTEAKVGIGTESPRTALEIAGGTITQNDSGPGNGQMSVLTAEGQLDPNGNFYVDVPSSLVWSWQADNFVVKVEVFVSLDYDSYYPHTFMGSAYSMAIVGKQRGAGLVYFTQLHTVSTAPPAVSFAYSSPQYPILRITVFTGRPYGIAYRATVKISH